MQRQTDRQAIYVIAGLITTVICITSISTHFIHFILFYYILSGGPVIYTIIHTISNASSIGSRDLKRFLMLRTPLFFLLMFLTLWFVLIFYLQNVQLYFFIFVLIVALFVLLFFLNFWLNY